eukprot:7389667-Alexandrium_andersonii.AAC.1
MSDQSGDDDTEEAQHAWDMLVGRWLKPIRQLPLFSAVGFRRYGFNFVGTFSGFRDSPVNE